MGYSQWGSKELDTTQGLSTIQHVAFLTALGGNPKPWDLKRSDAQM